MASSATRGARSARTRPSLMQSPAAADLATSWNTTGIPPAEVPSRSRMPPRSSSQRPTVSDSGRTGSPAPIVTPTPNACSPPAASAPYSRSAAPPPTTTIASGCAAASPATARAAAAATLRSSSGGSLAAEPSASGISRGGCGQTAPATSMASVCRSYAHGGHPWGCRTWSGQPPYAVPSAAVRGPVRSRAADAAMWDAVAPSLSQEPGRPMAGMPSSTSGSAPAPSPAAGGAARPSLRACHASPPRVRRTLSGGSSAIR
jgi:hypothetical protein